MSNETTSKPSFTLPPINDSDLEWGPPTTGFLHEFNGIPYTPFSKADRIGKFADWSTDAQNRQQTDNRKQNRKDQAYGASGENPFAFTNVDDASFSLVDNKSTQKKTTLTRGAQNFRSNQRPVTREVKKANTPQRNNWSGRANRVRDTSIRIGSDWIPVEDIELNRIAKLSHNVIDPVDLSIHGQLSHYNKKYDKPTQTDSYLKSTEQTKHNVTTSDDPIIQAYTKDDNISVFITDTILALLMCSPRSIAPWDILVNRVGDKLFFDKRDGGPIDSITVNENASEPPIEPSGNEKENINSPLPLSNEAMNINHNFKAQVLDHTKTLKFDKPDPFLSSEGANKVHSAAYRYRRFELDTEISMIVRHSIDGYQKGADGTDKYLLIRALNEFDSKAPGAGGAFDWRSKLDSQRGAVVATEMKNNNCKLTRWAVQASLAGASQLKLGWVSRMSPRDNRRHQILTTMLYRPNDFLAQMNFQFSTGWGIVYAIVRLCLNLEEGSYILVKDPVKPIVKLYATPSNQFNNEDSDEEIENDGEAETQN